MTTILDILLSVCVEAKKKSKNEMCDIKKIVPQQNAPSIQIFNRGNSTGRRSQFGVFDKIRSNILVYTKKTILYRKQSCLVSHI